MDRAGSLARTLEPGLIMPADLSGMDLLDAVRRSPASEYLLVEPAGQVFGVLAARDVEQAFAAGHPHPLTRSGSYRGGPEPSGHWPFRSGDHIQLTDPKGRNHLLTLEHGRAFHTHGAPSRTTSIGAPEAPW